MAQRMIHQHYAEHGFADRCRAYADAGIVTAMRFDHDGFTLLVDRASRQANARSRLDRDVDHYILAGRDAAEDAARIVRQKAFRRHLIAMLGALLADRREAGS